MRFNWGKGIALFYISFVAFMIFMVVKSSRYDLNLVTTDYYEKDLAFEDHRKKLVNSKSLEKDVEIEHSSEEGILTFRFPDLDRQVEGTILFFRPSDGKQDRLLNIQPDHSNSMAVSTKQLAGGHWRVLIDWSDGVKAYYSEAVLIL